MSSCEIEGCNRRQIARGLCHTHYKRWQTWGDPNRSPYSDAAKHKRCSVDECENKQRSSGFCIKHYQRFKNHGDPSIKLIGNGTGYINGGYLMIGAKKNRRLIHRNLWEQKHGPIPEGFVIHHKNHIRTDNRDHNLELMSNSEHCRLHAIHQNQKRNKKNGRFIKSTKTSL